MRISCPTYRYRILVYILVFYNGEVLEFSENSTNSLEKKKQNMDDGSSSETFVNPWIYGGIYLFS